MKIYETTINSHNLDQILERSRIEFLGINQSYPEFRLRFSLGIQDPVTELKYYELKSGSEVCASFHLVKKKLILSGQELPVCFLSQVIISPKHRGQGMSYELEAFAKKEAIQNGIGVTFVIARRAVKDLYAKLGFVGFSHFSKIQLKSIPDFKLFDLRAVSRPKTEDLTKLLDMYEQSYANLKFHFKRSVDSFKCYLEMPNYEIKVSSDLSYYWISCLDRIVEVGMTENAKCDEVIAIIVNQGYKYLQLNRNHKIFQYAISRGMHDSDRFELREGHLLQVHKQNLNICQHKELGIFLEHPGVQCAEIPEIDQW